MSEKGTFVRTGSASEPMPSRLIEELYSKRTRNSIGKIKSPNQELKFEQLRIYYDAAGKALNLPFTKTLELLNEDDQLNYVAYLLADNNNISVKVAKYAGTTRVDLIQSDDFGFCSLVKATKQILDKVEVENKTFTKITSKERIERKKWNSLALREAVINAMVHNDYTYELAPKFEFFSDRFELTSYGGLPQGLSQEEVFEGISIPRSKELMRVFRDMELVEQLGSGVPRILQSYSRECFHFSDNYIRMSFPMEEVQTGEAFNVGANVGVNVGANVGANKLVEILSNNPGLNAKQLSAYFDVTSRTIERWIKQLRTEGKIKFKGERKTGGYWVDQDGES